MAKQTYNVMITVTGKKQKAQSRLNAALAALPDPEHVSIDYIETQEEVDARILRPKFFGG